MFIVCHTLHVILTNNSQTSHKVDASFYCPFRTRKQKHREVKHRQVFHSPHSPCNMSFHKMVVESVLIHLNWKGKKGPITWIVLVVGLTSEKQWKYVFKLPLYRHIFQYPAGGSIKWQFPTRSSNRNQSVYINTSLYSMPSWFLQQHPVYCLSVNKWNSHHIPE